MSQPTFAGKRIVILGLARQGTALARFFLREGAQVTISDVAPADQLSAPLTELAGQPVRLVLGGHPPELLDNCDLLCLSGGVPPQMLTLQHSPAPAIGITGSSGKTTTTTLVGLMMNDERRTMNAESRIMNPDHDVTAHSDSSFIIHHSSFRAWVGGNIGVPLVDKLAQVQPEDWLVLELSSFQLELFDGESYGAAASPRVAAVLNITPNHLDRHPSMAHYIAAKANLLRWQGQAAAGSGWPAAAQDVCILGADDAVTGAWLRAKRVDIAAGSGQETRSFSIAGRLLGFGLSEPVGDGCWLDSSDRLVLRLDGGEQVVAPAHALKLRGRHNLLNMAAACAISAAAGAQPAAMAAVATSFTGVEHRLELVRQRDGVRWYNDSIATAPERAAAALLSFDEPIVLLAGGRDKKLPWQDFARLVHQRVRGADLPAAVAAAARAAQPGDVVLLSPGGTSFDAYKDFAARGHHFRTLVNEL